MSGSDSDFEIDIDATADKVLSSLALLPAKSKDKYEKAYQMFKKWCERKSVAALNEKVLLAYFSTELANFKSSSTFSIYSMLRATLSLRDNIDISDYKHLRVYLKRKSDGYSARKSRIFTKEEVYTFIKEAPDFDYLAMKVVLIVGLYGACRRNEFVNIRPKDVEYIHSGIKITLPKTKKQDDFRQFIIDAGNDPAVSFIDIFKRYAALRTDGAPESRFFISYRWGKCGKQPMGIHLISSFPRRIAAFLKLPFEKEYTGHCFRRTSASLLAHIGVNLSTMRQWKPDAVVEGVYNLTQQQPEDPAEVLVKCEPFDQDMDDESTITIVKCEPFDEEDMSVTGESNFHRTTTTTQLSNFPSSQPYEGKQMIGSMSCATQKYKCEECGHINTIIPATGGGNDSQSIKNSQATSAYQVSLGHGPS